MADSDKGLTELLHAWQRGEAGAESELFTATYYELRRRVAVYMRGERPGHTLQATALVNEAWIELQKRAEKGFGDRNHFFAAAAKIMRHILIEHARRMNSEKRGGDRLRVTLNDQNLGDAKVPEMDILALHEALTEFEIIDPVRSRVVELRYFCGLSIDATADVLGRSVRSVNRDWFTAKAWLSNRLGG